MNKIININQIHFNGVIEYKRIIQIIWSVDAY